MNEVVRTADPKALGSVSAFPGQERDASGMPRVGMEWGLTKREYIATQVLAAACGIWPWNEGMPRTVWAVKMADILLLELEK